MCKTPTIDSQTQRDAHPFDMNSSLFRCAPKSADSQCRSKQDCDTERCGRNSGHSSIVTHCVDGQPRWSGQRFPALTAMAHSDRMSLLNLCPNPILWQQRVSRRTPQQMLTSLRCNGARLMMHPISPMMIQTAQTIQPKKTSSPRSLSLQKQQIEMKTAPQGSVLSLFKKSRSGTQVRKKRSAKSVHKFLL